MLKVMDFFVKGKLIINATNNTLASPVDFHILINDNGRIRELVACITKKFKYEISIVSSKYDQLKLKEYNILSDFIKNTKPSLIEKWKLDENLFKDLEIGLEICLIENYSSMNAWDKCLEKINVLFKRGL